MRKTWNCSGLPPLRPNRTIHYHLIPGIRPSLVPSCRHASFSNNGSFLPSQRYLRDERSSHAIKERPIGAADFCPIPWAY